MASSDDVVRALAARHPPPEWAFFTEVSNETGFRANRRADAVALGIWPSRGLAIHGYEVKVSRSDWLRELRDPKKSAAVQRYCDYWWVAAGDDSVAKPEELPATWGLLVLKGKRLGRRVDAPKLEPEPLSRGFAASLLRTVPETTVPKASVQELVEARISEQVERSERSMRRSSEALEKRLKESEGCWKDLADIAGPNVVHDLRRRYVGVGQGEKVARAIRFVADGGVAGQVDKILRLREHAREILGSIEEILEIEGKK